MSSMKMQWGLKKEVRILLKCVCVESVYALLFFLFLPDNYRPNLSTMTKAQKWVEVQAAVAAAYPAMTKKEQQDKAIAVHRRGNRDLDAFQELVRLGEAARAAAPATPAPSVPSFQEVLEVVKAAYPNQKPAQHRKTATTITRGTFADFTAVQKEAEKQKRQLKKQQTMLFKLVTHAENRNALHAGCAAAVLILTLTQLSPRQWLPFASLVRSMSLTACVAASLTMSHSVYLQQLQVQSAACVGALLAGVLARFVIVSTTSADSHVSVMQSSRAQRDFVITDHLP